jgi:CheY-like chemotaxis protein
VSTEEGDQALRVARESHPDLILVDMLLPSLDGPEVLRALKKDPITAQIPAIVKSSLEQKNETRLKKDGAAVYFEKSKLGLDTDSQSLIQVVIEALAQRHTSAN